MKRKARRCSYRLGRTPTTRRAATVALIALLLTVVCTADGAVASPFRRLASSVVAFSSDGTHYAAWQVTPDSPIVVLDARNGRQKSYSGCALPRGGQPPVTGTAAAGHLLVVCGKGFGLLDAVRGTQTTLPPPAGLYDGAWETVGSRYVEGNADPLDCAHSATERKNGDTGEGPPCLALYDIQTGTLSYRPGSQAPDLDRPGAPLVCPPLRGKLASELSDPFPGGFTFGDDVLAEAVQHGDAPVRRIRIRRCRGHSKLISTTPEPRDMLIAGGLLSWDTGHPGTQYDAEGLHPNVHIHSGRLWTYQLATGRRRSVPLPLTSTLTPFGKMRSVLGYSSHAGQRLFWIAAASVDIHGDNVETSAVYSTPLTRR
jgi:hypothetical protein